jgi:hypothetical protein
MKTPSVESSTGNKPPKLEALKEDVMKVAKRDK